VKDVNELLREKERDIERLRQEIEALRSSIPLLSSDDQPPVDDTTSELQAPKFPATSTTEPKGWRRRFRFMSR
jgi:hypothetical protein